MQIVKSEVFDLQVWKVIVGEEPHPACVVQMIYMPETETFHLLLSEDDIEELIEYWLNAGGGDARLDQAKNTGTD